MVSSEREVYMQHEIAAVRRMPCSWLLLTSFLGLTGCVSEELEQRVAMLQERTAKVEKALVSLEAENADRSAQVNESLKVEIVQNNAHRDHLRSELNERLDEVYRQVGVLRKDIIESVQKANTAVLKNVDDRLSPLDVLLGTILMRLEELEKRPASSKK